MAMLNNQRVYIYIYISIYIYIMGQASTQWSDHQNYKWLMNVNTPIRVGGLLRAFGETRVGGKPLGKFLDGVAIPAIPQQLGHGTLVKLIPRKKQCRSSWVLTKIWGSPDEVGFNVGFTQCHLHHPPKITMWQCVKTLYPWWTSK